MNYQKLILVGNVTKDAHSVTDGQFAELRRVLREHNGQDERLKQLSQGEMDRHVDTQVVELTWLEDWFVISADLFGKQSQALVLVELVVVDAGAQA